MTEKRGAPGALAGRAREFCARARQRETAALGGARVISPAQMRSKKSVTPEDSAERARRKVAVRSSARGAPKISIKAAPRTLAARGVHARAQDGFGVASAHQGQGRGIDAELRQSDTVQPPGFPIEKILPRPQQRPSLRRAQGEGETETGGGGPIGAARRQHFMQTGALQPAAKDGVNLRRAQGEGFAGRRLAPAVAPRLDPGESQTQGGQVF